MAKFLKIIQGFRYGTGIRYIKRFYSIRRSYNHTQVGRRYYIAVRYIKKVLQYMYVPAIIKHRQVEGREINSSGDAKNNFKSPTTLVRSIEESDIQTLSLYNLFKVNCNAHYDVRGQCYKPSTQVRSHIMTIGSVIIETIFLSKDVI